MSHGKWQWAINRMPEQCRESQSRKEREGGESKEKEEVNENGKEEQDQQVEEEGG